jgi:hypothetical protein
MQIFLRLFAGGAAAAVLAAAPAASAATEVARLALVEGTVSVAAGRAAFAPAKEGAGIVNGTKVRTGSQALARLDFPVMSVTAGGDTELGVSGAVLSLELAHGRAEIASKQADIVKVVAAGGEVRGDGWAVVRREGKAVQVTVVQGRFFVTSSGHSLAVTSGAGAVFTQGAAPSAVELPSRPQVISPGADAAYVAKGEPLDVSWTPSGRSHVQLLAIGSEEVLMDRDIDGAKTTLSVPWPGLYRWRVAGRDAAGLEGVPSTEGLICVLDRQLEGNSGQ